MKIVLLGPPGAGKGTQAARISQEFVLPHISTGDIFRKNLKEKTPVGLKAQQYIDKGLLVPDEVVIQIVEAAISEDNCATGFMLDGFPRTVPQAQALDKVVDIDCVINIDVDRSKLLARLTGRRVCISCGKTYHIASLNGQTKCECGSDLIQRVDDTEETVRKRLYVYDEQTMPLIDYYQKANKLYTVDGSNSIDAVFNEVAKILWRFK